ncbi:putative malate dehydrogenase (oxaloacetate-decarboxylating) (NADP(+)) [Helianthus annuus]|uniref:Malic enzyme n=1 Tax=Helianthus annuus TaxID=4232 RepID=A0A9K3J445_HELAN|nr:putative malate dehydrogenase (oxaloacetate-decarboxylating) (NADP(+)) [Helianthus annuus]KAJ0929667.1 putative malate dehydrogenase (oxaloacetate-decarboxylating) (NADP(+)) [Helianthus annuus]
MFYCCLRSTKPVAGKQITHSPQINPPALPKTKMRLIQLGHSRSLAATICNVRSHLTYPQPLARRTTSTAPEQQYGEYAELMNEFMSAVKQNYGEKVLIQFEDFANHNAFDLLAKYSPTHLVFNDDIQGTASVVLAGLISALKLVGESLADHRFLFLGAGEAGTGIAELIALEISKQTRAPLEEARKKIWLVDSKGRIVKSQLNSLQHFKKP